jgi:hypothetical protein
MNQVDFVYVHLNYSDICAPFLPLSLSRLYDDVDDSRGLHSYKVGVSLRTLGQCIYSHTYSHVDASREEQGVNGFAMIS